MRATGEFVRALNAELEKQAALAMARAVVPAEADAQEGGELVARLLVGAEARGDYETRLLVGVEAKTGQRPRCRKAVAVTEAR